MVQYQSRSGFQPLSNGAFWQIESFDLIIRSPEQLERIRSTIMGILLLKKSGRMPLLPLLEPHRDT